MLEIAVVTLVVTVAFLYVAWAILPAATRSGLARRCATAAAADGSPRWLAWLAGRLAKAAGNGASPCGDCAAGSAHRGPSRREDA